MKTHFHPSCSRTSFRPRRRKGFSLIEMICVMAIIAVLSTLSWSVMGVFRANDVKGSLSVLSGVFDLARQTAISKNSAVWVVFTEPASAGEDIKVAVIGSKSGADPITGSASTIQMAGNADLELLGKVRSLPRVEIVDAGQVSLPNLPAGGSTSSLATVSIQIQVGGQPRIFTRALQFTPTGEARVNSSVGLVEMGIRPKTAGASPANVAVMRLAGVTGKVSLFRPE